MLQNALVQGQRASVQYGTAADSENLKRDHRDIVIVAAWRRPAFLLRTLVHLMQAAGGMDQFYLVLLDLHSSTTVEEVAAALPVPHLLLRMPPHFFMQAGMSLQLRWYPRNVCSQNASNGVSLTMIAFVRVGQFLLTPGRLPLCSVPLHSTWVPTSLSCNIRPIPLEFVVVDTVKATLLFRPFMFSVLVILHINSDLIRWKRMCLSHRIFFCITK